VPFVTSYCCPPNVLRTIAEVNGCAYSKSDDAVWVNIYGGSKLSTTLRGQPLILSQQSRYPWDGRVRLLIERCPNTEFSVKLRIPGWAERASVSLNDSPADIALAPATYVDVRRRWKAGDVLTLELPMPVRLMEANPLVEEMVNQVAVQRGPIVYCLESPDVPNGVRVHDVAIPADAKLGARHNTELLQGVTIIEGEVMAKLTGDWSGRLYRALQQSQARQVNVRFIPYYAWSNRGPSEMSVWLPVK
jgi:DUF1680 family protein